MSYRLIVSEKPSVSTSIAYCVGAAEKIPIGNSFYRQGSGYIVTNALGHLFCIGMPEDYGFKKWDIDTLPIVPEKFKLFPLKRYDEQIKILETLFSRDDVTEIINACDAGREGECIFRYIYNYFGCNKPVKRLWISSLTDESIRQEWQICLTVRKRTLFFLPVLQGQKPIGSSVCRCPVYTAF